MKVFLSHSSKDKGFVESVAALLRPGTFELDSETFDAGLLNSQAIITSLQRCDLFCLFLSTNSINSSYVEFETLLGIEFLASGKVGRFLAVCLDDKAFASASTNVKFFNIIRKSLEIESAARLIQGHLVSAAERSANHAHPFIGREEELVELEVQVTDHSRPTSKALFISGNFGAGRRTIAQKFYENYFPKVGRSFPTVNIDQFAGLEELYRKVLAALRPAITTGELKTRIQGFAIANIDEKRRLVAQLLNSLLLANEAALLIDKGGILADAGNLTVEISPPLQIAVERDKRLRLPQSQQKTAIKNLARSLSIRLEEGTAPISLVDAAVLSSLDSGDTMSELAAAFLLPSHNVWLAKKHYDGRHWEDSIRFASEALAGGVRLSSDGFVAACRYLCLAAARLGEATTFESGIAKLEAVAKDDWAKSNIAFLKGFNLRLKGNLPTAESCFRESYNLSPGNLSAARELAAICLARDNLDEAEQFAREARSHAPTNAYLLDILISVLVRKHGRSAKHMSEINDMFDMLEKVGEEGGRSFFTTRKAEFEHLCGNNKEALKLVSDAIKKTPTIFEPRRLQAEILLKDGNKAKALEAINTMRDIVNARDPDERRTNYRLYLKTYAHYLTEVEKWAEAKEIYDDQSVFTDEERKVAIREVEIIQGFKAKDRSS